MAWQRPIGCGGVAVFHGDVVVDMDGAVLILAELLVALAPEQERLEAWMIGAVERGAALPGL